MADVARALELLPSRQRILGHLADRVDLQRMREAIKEGPQGRAALRALLDCFTHPLKIYAVRKVAEDALARWEEFECAGYIRHPAQGGEARFREGFRTLVAAGL